MAIPPDQLSAAAALLREMEDRVPPEVRDRVKLAHRQEGNALILFEFRPRLMMPGEWQESYVAKFVYVQSRECWRLFRQNRNLRWQLYEELPEASTFERLFREVESDPLCFFWG